MGKTFNKKGNGIQGTQSIQSIQSITENSVIAGNSFQ